MVSSFLVSRETDPLGQPPLDNLTDQFRGYAEVESASEVSEKILLWGGVTIAILIAVFVALLCIGKQCAGHQRPRRENVRDAPDQGMPLQQFSMPYRLVQNYAWGTGPLGIEDDELASFHPQVPSGAPPLPPSYTEATSENTASQHDRSSRTRASFSTSVEPRQRQLRARDVLRPSQSDRITNGVIDEADSSHESRSCPRSTTQNRRQSSPEKEQSLTRNESRLRLAEAAGSSTRPEQPPMDRNEMQNRSQPEDRAAMSREQSDKPFTDSSRLSESVETRSFDGTADWSSLDHRPSLSGQEQGSRKMDQHDVPADYQVSPNNTLRYSEGATNSARQDCTSKRSSQPGIYDLHVGEGTSSAQQGETVCELSNALDNSQSHKVDESFPTHPTDCRTASNTTPQALEEEDSDAGDLAFAINMSLQADTDSELDKSLGSPTLCASLSKGTNHEPGSSNNADSQVDG